MANKNLLVPLSIIIAGALIGGVLIFSDGSSGNSLSVNADQANLRKVDLEIKNLFCIGCRSSVVNSVRALHGVIQADADPGTDSGWVVYDVDAITKEQIVAAPIFQAYPVRILNDQSYGGGVEQEQVEEMPLEVEQKLNELARQLQNRGIQLESFFQEELDDAISRGYWNKASNLLDNFLKSI